MYVIHVSAEFVMLCAAITELAMVFYADVSLPSHRIVLFGREKLRREMGAAGSEHLLWRARELKPQDAKTNSIVGRQNNLHRHFTCPPLYQTTWQTPTHPSSAYMYISIIHLQNKGRLISMIIYVFNVNMIRNA